MPTLEQLLISSIALVQAQAQARRALAESRRKFGHYKKKHALKALERAHEFLSIVVEADEGRMDTGNEAS